jgi:hypothetical protein
MTGANDRADFGLIARRLRDGAAGLFGDLPRREAV